MKTTYDITSQIYTVKKNVAQYMASDSILYICISFYSVYHYVKMLNTSKPEEIQEISGDLGRKLPANGILKSWIIH